MIVASTSDPASRNIADALIRLHDFSRTIPAGATDLLRTRGVSDDVQLLITDQRLVSFSPSLTLENTRLLVFVSRHESLSGLPSLTVHAPGNLGQAQHGGAPRTVSVAAPAPMKDALKTLSLEKKRRGLGQTVSYEATHHGPTLEKPCLFIEIGSSEVEWSQVDAAETVAKAAMHAATYRNKCTPALGIGGPHYNPKFTESALETSLALGHIIPKYALSSLTPAILEQCLAKTLGGVQVALIDWKGTPGPARRWIVAQLEERGIQVQRV